MKDDAREILSKDEIAILACRPVDPEEYQDQRRDLWLRVKNLGMPEPPVYPGSTTAECYICGIAIYVGPKAQEQIEHCQGNGIVYAVTCIIDAAMLMLEWDSEGAKPASTVRSLGNTFKRR